MLNGVRVVASSPTDRTPAKHLDNVVNLARDLAQSIERQARDEKDPVSAISIAVSGSLSLAIAAIGSPRWPSETAAETAELLATMPKTIAARKERNPVAATLEPLLEKIEQKVRAAVQDLRAQEGFRGN